MMSVRGTELPADNRSIEATDPRSAASDSLPTYRLNVLRIGYLVLGLGLALVKWPLFFQNGGLGSLPVFEGVVAALLTAMSLLAFLGLRYPRQLLPLLVFESLWKLIWLAAVGVPHLLAGDMDAQMRDVFFTVLLVVVILAVIPWRYAVGQYVTKQGDPWRTDPTRHITDSR
jgi:hypothetical protein